MQNKTAIAWTILKILMGLFMIFGGVQHFLKPDFYLPFVPDFFVFEYPIIYGSGVIEILVGLFLLTKQYAGWGALGFLILMLVFLPIHVADLLSEQPAVGSEKAAWIRLAVQFVLIAIGWKLQNLYYKK